MTAPNFASGAVWTGDNLPIMRGINSACVDLIYLDPPFNSNENYAAPIGSRAPDPRQEHDELPDYDAVRLMEMRQSLEFLQRTREPYF